MFVRAVTVYTTAFVNVALRTGRILVDAHDSKKKSAFLLHVDSLGFDHHDIESLVGPLFRALHLGTGVTTEKLHDGISICRVRMHPLFCTCPCLRVVSVTV